VSRASDNSLQLYLREGSEQKFSIDFLVRFWVELAFSDRERMFGERTFVESHFLSFGQKSV
jgi:hypothetical protein